MRSIRLSALSFVLLLSIFIQAAGAANRTVDSTEALLKFYRSAQGLSAAEKVQLFKSMVVPTNPEFYEYRFADWKNAGLDPDQELLKQIDQFPAYAGRFNALHKDVVRQFLAATELFQKRFAGFRLDYDVYVLHSLGTADGTVREIAGKQRFIIGLDMIAARHDYDNNTPFFQHELLHAYHNQFYTQTGTLYSHLWREGLAVYVSHVLNPNATWQELMLAGNGFTLPERVDPMLPQVAESLLSVLDATDWQVHRKYFGASYQDPKLPARSGYYVGYLLAKELAKDHTLEELIRLQDNELAPKLRAQLVNWRANRDFQVVARLESVKPLSQYSGKVLSVAADPRYALTILVESAEPQTKEFVKGSSVTLAIHSPSLVFAGDAEQGGHYRFFLARQNDTSRTHFLLLRAERVP